MCCRHKQCGWFLWGVPFVLLFIAIGSLLVMLLWNSLIPEIFGIKAISYLQAIGLLMLSKILFGAFGRGHRHFYSHRYWRKNAECEHESPIDENKKD